MSHKNDRNQRYLSLNNCESVIAYVDESSEDTLHCLSFFIPFLPVSPSDCVQPRTIMDENIDVVCHETLRRSNGKIIEVIYQYTETQKGATLSSYDVSVKREDYDKVSAPVGKEKLLYDRFLKVLRPFMMGLYAADDIPRAFEILDADSSGKIDVNELAAYLPAIVPDATASMLLNHLKKVDSDSDYKLTLTEFTELIIRGIGRDISKGKE